MTIYDPAIHEWLLVQWWHLLANTPDGGGRRAKSGLTELQAGQPAALHTLTEFLYHFKYRASLAIEMDAKGIWFAGATSPLGDGADFGVWLRASHRGTLRAWRATEMAFTAALIQYSVIYSFTRIKELHALFQRLGYKYTGYLPGFMGGSTVYLYAMTRASWERARDERKTKVEGLALRLESSMAVHQ